jgi:hypothetical protein
MERVQKQILQALYKDKLSVYKLIDMQDSSLREFFQLVQKLKGELITLEKGKVSLTQKGLETCKTLGVKEIGELACGSCEGTGYAIPEFFAGVLKDYSTIAEERPEAVEKYDQGFISLDGVIRRLEFIYERGDLVNSEIFVVGDDDLLSIAVALTGLPKSVFVVDVDERLISFINKKAEEHDLPVRGEVYDVQQALPERFNRKFDVFVTDPVETLPGLKLFLSRGVSTLKDVGCSGYFGLTTLESSRKKWYQLQRMIYDMGFVITDVRRKFNVYPQDKKSFFRFQEKLPIVKKLRAPVDYNWYKSALLRIEAVKEPRPLVEGEVLIDERVYKDDESWATPY